MRQLPSLQLDEIADPVRAKFAMAAPVLEATLHSVSQDRIARLGGYEDWTLADLGREYREGSGDAGICFEWAVHDAIASQHPLIWPLASEVLSDLCGIDGGAASLLFGPEKDGRIPILETVTDSLTDDSRVYVGNRGHPPKLRRYIPQIINAHFREEVRAKLPRSIRGIWKADLFIGNAESQKWVGTTVKSVASGLKGAQGLRVGIYPKANAKDTPRVDEDLGLIRLPLPYDGDFMELYYKSFYLVRAFLLRDAQLPSPVHLPDAEDRYVCQELAARREFPLLQVLDVIREMSQPDLLNNEEVSVVQPTTALTETGLEDDPLEPDQASFVSLTPRPATEG